jgi:hypothetical protein
MRLKAGLCMAWLIQALQRGARHGEVLTGKGKPNENRHYDSRRHTVDLQSLYG